MCGRVCRARDICCAVGVVARERCLVGLGYDLSSCATLFSTRGSDVHWPARLVHPTERLNRTARVVHRTERLNRPATLAVTARVRRQ